MSINLLFLLSSVFAVSTMAFIYILYVSQRKCHQPQQLHVPLFIVKFMLAKEINACKEYWQLSNCISYRDSIIDNYAGDEELTDAMNYLAGLIQAKEAELMIKEKTTY